MTTARGIAHANRGAASVIVGRCSSTNAVVRASPNLVACFMTTVDAGMGTEKQPAITMAMAAVIANSVRSLNRGSFMPIMLPDLWPHFRGGISGGRRPNAL